MAITKEFNTFFKELSRNNHKEWFDENRKRYEQSVKNPFLGLVAEVIAEMKKLDKDLVMEPKDAVFRINRDIRFSNDKSPYKLHMAAHVGKGGKKDTQIPGIYFQVSPEAVMIGTGIYQPEKELVEKIRYHIAANLTRFEQIINDKKFTAYFSGIEGEKNKKLPADLKEAAEKQPIIYHKQFYCWKEYYGEKEALRKDLAPFIVAHFSACKKLVDFFAEAGK